ncbi:MAG: penicillin acylase family protein [Pyrinomonadaceae bacterium]
MIKRPLLLVSFFFLLSIAIEGQAPATKVVESGLSSSVTVRRDSRGIPYIEAISDADVYFAQGYTVASDRLWQMDLMRRVARGETAEIFGKQALEEDKRWRRFNFARIAEENLKYLSPDLRTALDSYAQGVNAYIKTLDKESLPVEFKILQYFPREWTPADTVVIGKILSDALSTTWRNDLLRASLQSLPKDKLGELTNPVTPYDVILFGNDGKSVASTGKASWSLSVSSTLLTKADQAEAVRRSSLEKLGLYAEELAASNNWVISGKHTADGKPILANDPHLAPTAPGIWYLAHLSTPSLRVSGVTFPGVPGIILGHNADIAWGATNVGPDVQDLYYETFNEKGEYKTANGWKEPKVRKETIKVRGNLLKPATDDFVLDVIETQNGPIILEDGGKKYALKWTAFDPKNNEFEAFYRWNRARNWSEFKAGLRTYGGAAQNFVYADVKGNIGWYAASRIPIRRVGDGGMPYDGSTTDGDWVGTIPFEELPNLYNPPSGLIVTANQRIVGTSYKYSQMSRDSAAPWRARRITDLLNGRSKVTMDDVRDVQHDVYNIPLANLASEIIKASAASTETLNTLRSWDGRMTPDSRGALLANDIRACLGNKIADANRPVPGYLIREKLLDRVIKEGSPSWLPSEFKSYPEMIRSCDSAVRVSLSDAKRYGSDDSKWVWGKISESRFPHPLAAAPFVGGQFSTPRIPISGSGQTPNVGSNVSMRHIVSPGNWDTTRHVIPLGESGDPKSAHFKDQFDAWASGTPMIFPFSKKAVEAAAEISMVMLPR